MRTTLLVLSITLSACISVNIGNKKLEKSGKVSYEPPSDPYKTINSTSTDRAWQNPNNGNTISYFSSCHEVADPDLKTMRDDLVSGIKNLKVIEEDTINYNSREAIRSRVSGQVDGVNTEVEFLLFKKNNCIYTLSYVALAKHFVSDRKNFSSFIERFEAR